MRIGSATLVFAVLTAAWLGTATAESPVPGPDAVHVMDNSQYYHRADCRRLHFGQATTLADAAARYRPCPICRPPLPGEEDTQARTSAPAVATPAATVSAPARPEPAAVSVAS